MAVFIPASIASLCKQRAAPMLRTLEESLHAMWSVSRLGAIHGRDLLRYLDISVRDLPSEVVTRQLERHFGVRDEHVRMVIDHFEVGDEAIHKAER